MTAAPITWPIPKLELLDEFDPCCLPNMPVKQKQQMRFQFYFSRKPTLLPLLLEKPTPKLRPFFGKNFEGLCHLFLVLSLKTLKDIGFKGNPKTMAQILFNIVLQISVKKILAVINATYAVAKRKPEKIRLAGIRTLTSAIPVQRSNQLS